MQIASVLPRNYQGLRSQFIEIYQPLAVEQKDRREQLTFTDTNLVYRLVKEACYALGFFEVDAQSIACAWKKQQSNIETFDLLAWPDNPDLFDIMGRSMLSMLSEPTVAPMPSVPATTFSSAQPRAVFPSCPNHLGLYVIAPNAQWIGQLAQAGVKTLQLRFKSEDPQAIRREVLSAITLAQAHDCHLYINDYWQLAIEFGAYGVHLGQDDLNGADFDAIKNAQLRLGISTHGYAEMIRADAIGPSYIAMGAIFPTNLKVMPTAPQGLARLAKYAKLMQSYPIVAIGGIDETNLATVLACQVGSVAMVRSVINAPDYLATIQHLEQLISLHLKPAKDLSI